MLQAADKFRNHLRAGSLAVARTLDCRWATEDTASITAVGNFDNHTRVVSKNLVASTEQIVAIAGLGWEHLLRGLGNLADSSRDFIVPRQVLQKALNS